jgi:hypothetical protein
MTPRIRHEAERNQREQQAEADAVDKVRQEIDQERHSLPHGGQQKPGQHRSGRAVDDIGDHSSYVGVES